MATYINRLDWPRPSDRHTREEYGQPQRDGHGCIIIYGTPQEARFGRAYGHMGHEADFSETVSTDGLGAEPRILARPGYHYLRNGIPQWPELAALPAHDCPQFRDSPLNASAF